MVNIAINASGAGSAGLNFNSFIAGFDANFNPAPPPTGNSGWFYDATSPYSRYGIDGDSTSTAFADADAFLANGEFTYSLTTNTLEGDLDSLAFGSNLNLGQGSGFTNTLPTLDDTFLSISNLGIVNSTGTSGLAHSIVFGVITNNNPGALLDYLFNTSGNNVNFTGSSGADAITAGIGNDTLNGNNGGDTLNGGAGADIISGGGGGDNITGGNAADALNGNGGNDNINGGAGNDTINGGTGNDVLTGNGGSDRFVFSSGTDADGDTISAFTSGADRIDLGWSFTWNATGNDPGEVFFDDGVLYGEDATGAAFEITIGSGTVVQTDLI